MPPNELNTAPAPKLRKIGLIVVGLILILLAAAIAFALLRDRTTDSMETVENKITSQMDSESQTPPTEDRASGSPTSTPDTPNPQNRPTTKAPPQTEAKDTQMTPPPEAPIKTFTVTGQNFSFSPSNLTVSKGDKVKINFVNAGGTHDWVLDGYGVRTAVIQSGQVSTVEFTADKLGSFEYYCSVSNHRQLGMTGQLVVQ